MLLFCWFHVTKEGPVVGIPTKGPLKNSQKFVEWEHT